MVNNIDLVLKWLGNRGAILIIYFAVNILIIYSLINLLKQGILE